MYNFILYYKTKFNSYLFNASRWNRHVVSGVVRFSFVVTYPFEFHHVARSVTWGKGWMIAKWITSKLFKGSEINQMLRQIGHLKEPVNLILEISKSKKKKKQLIEKRCWEEKKLLLKQEIPQWK